MSDALALIGERHTLPLLRELAYGYHRFTDLARLTGAPRTLLTTRLRTLEKHGIITSSQYSARPPRRQYHLTQAGAELIPVILTLKDWGERHATDGEPIAVFAHTCGHTLHPVTVCAHCREELRAGELTVAGGTHPPVLRP